MSELASGGKVWSIPSEDENGAAQSRPAAQWGQFFLRFTPFLLLTPILLLIFQNEIFSTEITGYKQILEGYAPDVKSEFNVGLTIGLIIPMGITMFVGLSLSEKFLTNYGPESPLAPVLTIVSTFVVFAALVFPNTDFKTEQKFSEWAKTTYGYTSIEEVEDNADFTTATKPNGEKVKVGVHRFENNLYLYENLAQLDTLEDRLNETKKDA